MRIRRPSVAAWRLLLPLVALVTLVLSVQSPVRAAPELDPNAPMDDPIPVVSEFVSEWRLNDGLLYWAYYCFGGEFRGDAYLRRMPSAGGPTRTLSTAGPSFCVTYASMDADETGLYYHNGDQTQIEFRPAGAPYDPPSVVFDTAAAPVNSQLVLDGDYIYWISRTAQKIHRVKRDGTDFAAVANTNAGPTSLAVNRGSVFWLDDTGLWLSNTNSCPGFPCSKTRETVTTGRYLVYYVPPFSLAGTYQLIWVEFGSQQRIRRLSCSNLIILPADAESGEGSSSRPDDASADCSASTIYTAPSGWSIGRPAIRSGGLLTPGTMYWQEGFFQIGSPSDGRLRRKTLDESAAVDIAVNLGSGSAPVYLDSQYVYYSHDGIKKLPLNASAIVRDLAADGLEVTQGVQNLANGAQLAGDKLTYVRGFARHNGGPSAASVNAVLHGSRNGNPLPGSPLQPVYGNVPLATGSTYDRADIRDGWLFRLPSSWDDAGAVTFRLDVDPEGSYDDPNPGNNELTRSVTFQNQPEACVIAIPVRTHNPLPSTSDPNYSDMVQRFEQLWPIPDVWRYRQSEPVEELQVCWWGPFPHPCYGPYELEEGWGFTNGPPDRDKAMASLIARALFSDDPDECDDSGASVHYMGMVHPSAPTDGVGGYANLFINASWVRLPPRVPDPFPSGWNQMWEASTMAQELSHNHNRGHVNCGNPGGVDNNFPFPNCQLDVTGQSSYYGLDTAQLRPIEPDQASDFMSYSPAISDGATNWMGRWVSRYTWNGLMGEFAALAAGSRTNTPRETAAGTVVASGVIDTENVQGYLNQLTVMPDGALSAGMAGKWAALSASAYAAGDPEVAAAHVDATYHLRLFDAQDTILDDRTIELLETDDHIDDAHSGVFAVTFPAPDASVTRVELLVDDTVLDSLSMGPGAPTVSILAPAGGAVIDSELTITWEAADPDDDPLLFTVQYSNDNGAHWQALVNDYPGTPESSQVSLSLATLSGLPGSNGQSARIRVIASDGFNTALATSQAFDLLDRPPVPFITSPGSETWYRVDQLIPLRGGATDAETGAVADDDLSWQIDNVPAGIGPAVDVTGLAPGDYTVSLGAEDAAGQDVLASSTLKIAPLAIPLAGTPAMDGRCTETTYSAGVQLPLVPYADGSYAVAMLLRTNSDLYVCFSNLKQGALDPGATAVVRVDVNHSRDTAAQNDDYLFQVGEDGGLSTFSGDGSGGFAESGPGGLEAQVSASATRWQAELKIAATALGGWEHPIGLALGHHALTMAGDDYPWPYAAEPVVPDSWAESYLGRRPLITSLNRISVTVGGPAFTLVVQGVDFEDGAVVRWEGTELPTTFGSSNVISASVGISRLVNAGTKAITVLNPGPDGVESAPAALLVRNSVPAITGLNPSSVAAESPELTLTVNGNGFVNGTTILWNGEPLATSFVSSEQLQAVVPASRLAQGQIAGVAAAHPAPDEGASPQVPFEVTPATSEIEVFLPFVTR